MRVNWWALAAAAALAALLLVVVTAPARAQTALRLSEATGAEFPERSYAVTLPSPRALGPRDVEVTENGRPVSGLTVLAPGTASTFRFGVVLAVDASRSMRGRPLRSAVRAARLFARHRDPAQPVAVVAFAGTAEVVQPFTTDSSAIDAAIADIELMPGRTHVLDAAKESVALIEAAHVESGSVVLLSDGGDHGSVATTDDVRDATSDARVRLFTVGLASGDDDFGTLNVLAAESQAEFSAATSMRDLSRIYERLGSRLASQYLIRYRSTAGAGERVTVVATVHGVPGTATAVYEAPTAGAAGREPFRHSTTDAVWRSGATAFVAILAAALLIGLALWLLVRPRGISARERMTAYVDAPPEPLSTSETVARNRMFAGAARSLDATSWGARLRNALDVARITMSPSQLAALVGAGALLLALLFTAIAGPAFGVLFAMIAPAIAYVVVTRKLRAQRELFRDQLPDNLQVISSAMRAGHSFSGALNVVVDDAPDPTRRELKRVIADERLGVPLDDAIELMVTRMASRDLAQVALVATLQRETGGNTAEVLDRVTDTVRERLALQRMIRTLTAQGRMSRWVVSLLPVVLLAIITTINPEYMEPLFETSIGRVLLVVAGLMVVTGSLVIKRVVDIKV